MFKFNAPLNYQGAVLLGFITDDQLVGMISYKSTDSIPLGVVCAWDYPMLKSVWYPWKKLADYIID